MTDEHYQLGSASRLKAEAIGLPGQRTFRLLIDAGGRTACIWLEKEQMQALSMAVDQLIAQLRANRVPSQSSDADVLRSSTTEFALPPEIEFKAGRLGLGYDEDTDTMTILVHDVDDEDGDDATLSVHASRAQMRSLSQEIGEVISAGRPRCPLCGTPMTAGQHVCPGSDGHYPTAIQT